MTIIRRMQRVAGEEQGNALMEFSMLGLTVLLPLMWIILCVFDIQRGMYGVSAAAREATRAFTLEDTVGDAQASARRAAYLAMRDQQLEISMNDIPPVSCGDGNGNESSSFCLQPSSTATIRIEYDVELPFVPSMFDINTSIGVASQHTTPYGQYRTGAG